MWGSTRSPTNPHYLYVVVTGGFTLGSTTKNAFSYVTDYGAQRRLQHRPRFASVRLWRILHVCNNNLVAQAYAGANYNFSGGHGAGKCRFPAGPRLPDAPGVSQSAKCASELLFGLCQGHLENQPASDTQLWRDMGSLLGRIVPARRFLHLQFVEFLCWNPQHRRFPPRLPASSIRETKDLTEIPASRIAGGTLTRGSESHGIPRATARRSSASERESAHDFASQNLLINNEATPPFRALIVSTRHSELG